METLGQTVTGGLEQAKEMAYQNSPEMSFGNTPEKADKDEGPQNSDYSKFPSPSGQ